MSLKKMVGSIGEELNPAPEEIQGVAKLNFGGENGNSAALTVDDRGILKVSAKIQGVAVAEDVHVPFSERVGAWHGPFQDVHTSFPVNGAADDAQTFGFLFSHDENSGMPRVAITSPYNHLQMGAYAFDKVVWGTPIFRNVLELAPLTFIGRSLAKSYDTFYPHSDTGFRFHKFATISNKNTLVGSYFTCLLCIGDYSLRLRKTFTVEVNIPAPTVALTQNTVNDQVRVTCLSEGTLVAPASGNGLPKIGVVQDVANGVVDLWLAIPSRSALFSCTTLNAGRSDLVSFSWENLRNSTTLAQMSGNAPAGVIWARMDFQLTTRRTFLRNDGSLAYVQSSKSILRVHHGSNRVDLLSYPFVALDGSRCAYNSEDFNASSLTVTVDANNVYSVSGASLTNIPFRFTLPSPQMSNTDDYVLRVETNDVAGKNFSFTLRKRVYTANTTTGAVTISLSDGLPIPTDTWIDVCVDK